MKRVILIAVTLSIGVITCQKTKINNVNDNSYNAETKKIISVIKTYLENSNSYTLKPNEEDDKPKCFWKIVKADAQGALEGAASGAAIGGSTGVITPIGGAILGGVILGTASSVEAAIDCQGKDNKNNSSSKIYNPNFLKGVIMNENNSYEKIGKAHNYLVYTILTNSDKYICINNKKQLCDTLYFKLLKEDKYLSSLILNNTFIDSGFVYTLLNISNSTNKEVSLHSGIESLYLEQKITNDEYLILREYATSLELLKNITMIEFENFSIQLENAIINSNLPEKSKAILLSTITTAKYSFAFNSINN